MENGPLVFSKLLAAYRKGLVGGRLVGGRLVGRRFVGRCLVGWCLIRRGLVSRSRHDGRRVRRGLLAKGEIKPDADSGQDEHAAPDQSWKHPRREGPALALLPLPGSHPRFGLFLVLPFIIAPRFLVVVRERPGPLRGASRRAPHLHTFLPVVLVLVGRRRCLRGTGRRDGEALVAFRAGDLLAGLDTSWRLEYRFAMRAGELGDLHRTLLRVANLARGSDNRTVAGGR